MGHITALVLQRGHQDSVESCVTQVLCEHILFLLHTAGSLHVPCENTAGTFVSANLVSEPPFVRLQGELYFHTHRLLLERTIGRGKPWSVPPVFCHYFTFHPFHFK